MDRLAILGSTLAQAIALASAPRDEEATRSAVSVAGVALDLASDEVRAQVGEELRANGQLGEGPDQFPAWPWRLWERDQIFHLLQSAEFATQEFGDMPLDDVIRMTPAMIFAAFGAPHKRVELPRWALYGLAGLAITGVAAGAAAILRKGRAWPD